LFSVIIKNLSFVFRRWHGAHGLLFSVSYRSSLRSPFDRAAQKRNRKIDSGGENEGTDRFGDRSRDNRENTHIKMKYAFDYKSKHRSGSYCRNHRAEEH
jgi:hypothetical protein